VLASAVALAIALAPGARLSAAPHSGGGDPEDSGAEPAAPGHAGPRLTAPGDSTAPRDALAHQLDDQTASIDRALATVDDKLTAADQARIHRLGSAVRAVHAGAGDEALAVARRRAAARLLLDRDLGERGLLADEIVRLRAARARIADEIARLPQLALPAELARPARGKIARHFGTLEHERSKALLSRRGIDIEVDDHSPVTAPAAGTVRYAGPIRGLDHGVILDHGDYLTVVAKLGDVALPVGAPIAAGDRIGRAARHRVYLEVRVKLGPGGLPIDPEPLLDRPRSEPATESPHPARRPAR
jgi:septal ring factor EnvC (AmiA/AmiB activator)